MREWLPLLVEAGLQATVVLAVAWGLSLGMRRASAATRHVLWTCALAGAVAVPLAAGLLPRWELAVPVLESAPRVSGLLATAPAAPAVEGAAVDVAVDARPPFAPVRVLAPGPEPAGVNRRMDLAWAAVAVWAAGALLVLLRLVGAGLAASRLRRTSREPDGSWVDEARTLAAAVGVSQPIRFVESDAIDTPMVLGVWRPMLAMPAGTATWPAARWRVVLLHELAHVRRRDCLTQLLAGVACAVYWFNPLVWLSAWRLRVERERACDDFVLTAGADGPDYAGHLLDIARATARRSLLQGAGVAMAHRSQLEGRLMAILDPGIRRSSALAGRLAAVALVGAVSIPVAAIQLRPSGPAPPVPSATDVLLTPRAVTPAGPAPRAQVAQAEQSATQEAEAAQAAQAEQSGVPQAPTAVRAVADDRVIEALIAALGDPDAGVRETVAQTLAATRDPRATAALVPLVGDPDPDIREVAVRALARNPSADAIPVLTTALQDDEPGVREVAVRTLGELRDPATIGALGTALGDTEADVRETAARALGELRDARTLGPLAGALNDVDPDVREAAVFALAELRDPDALGALVGALDDEEPDVRERAVFALGELRDARALDALIAALRDEEPDVREQAAHAIGQLSGR
jgi:HEAT repeat protein/beta-lactamase regulating signal transducer with metallopeptidase domain